MAVNALQFALTTIATLAAASLALRGYRQSLHPLYANVPTELYLPHIVYGSLALSLFAPRYSKRGAVLALGVVLCVLPHLLYRTAVYSSRWHDPVKGPFATHALCVPPLMYLFSAIMVRSSSGLHRRSLTLLFLGSVALTSWALIPPSVASTGPKRRAPDEIEPRTLLHRTIGLLLIASAIPRLAWEYKPTLRTPLEEPYLYPAHDPVVRILSSTHSVTGQIVVGEAMRPSDAKLQELGPNYLHSLRYLRADHSILGGVWIGERVATLGDQSAIVRDEDLIPLGDSIYSTFVLQEAARLVNSTEIGQAGAWKNALVIGLGIGVSASAFQRHGIATTVVEIDPAVYEAARDYFGLVDPGSGNVFLEDARSWVSRTKSKSELEDALGAPRGESFDIIVHDCFSGGGVPAHIFTIEFWEDLKAIMNPEGVLAVNFAGVIDSNPARAVLITLEQAFGHCRIFHDRQEELTPQQMKEEFLNMVLFCTLSSNLSFREAVHSDFLNSYLRQHILTFFTKHEIDPSLIRDSAVGPIGEEETHWVLTDNNNPLGKWQDEEGINHWRVMRDVLPDIFWEVY
ncbi:hypothetical protein PUNSTDRAFT_65035 [Punctularia strigosozonata HHB-11173 SS5]|uniref:uncharacterized protein n=1 Tax=Punctularia strigosozonata (strain HHB-11173) TaxID=741275 RepID=UPI0004417D31|nr:uncharacterized protein PUNSTDRAFT_65035 [Punctularia strigosozonata HHB-11173 SS5]EIN10543.1 hypothetical protein PUNSTDRAFT_65035 [Punctularia strigosozonata HHB-11173 SS5]